jgi:hypothetical protein
MKNDPVRIWWLFQKNFFPSNSTWITSYSRCSRMYEYIKSEYEVLVYVYCSTKIKNKMTLGPDGASNFSVDVEISSP